MPDTFRKEYKPLTDHQKALMLKMKEQAEVLDSLFTDTLPTIAEPNQRGRMIALARTNLEQSIMWAVKAITE